MAGDIEYLLTLGLTIDEIAHRAGRTPTAIQHELDEYRAAIEEQKRVSPD